METDGALDVEEMEKENRCMQISESKINTSPSGEPLEGENSVTVETPMAGLTPGSPLKAGVGMKLQTNPLEDSPRLRSEAALACGTSVKTHVPDHVNTLANQDENSEAEVKAKGTNFDDNAESSSDEIEGFIDARNSLTDSMDFRNQDVNNCSKPDENSSEAEESGLTVSNVSIVMNLFIDVTAASVEDKSRQNFENANVSSVLNESRVEIVSSGAECYDFIVSNDLIDAKTSLVEVMGKPLPKFCGSSANVIATSCYEENILKESQVRSPGDCENLSTECTESNDELRGNPGIFILVAYAMANFLQVEMQRVKMLLLKPYMMKNHRKMPQVRHCVTY